MISKELQRLLDMSNRLTPKWTPVKLQESDNIISSLALIEELAAELNEGENEGSDASYLLYTQVAKIRLLMGIPGGFYTKKAK